MSIDDAVAYASRGRGGRKRLSSGWASLTPTEREVVRLTAEGLTNPKIAERLFVAPSTVRAISRASSPSSAIPPARSWQPKLPGERCEAETPAGLLDQLDDVEH